MLDARLQDLQCSGRTDPDSTVLENITHIRHVMAENQKAMGSLVHSMTLTQEEIRSMANILGSLYNAVANGQPLAQVKQLRPESRSSSEDKAPVTPTASAPPGDVIPARGAKKRLHNLRVSIRKPRLKSSSSDDPPTAV